MIKTLLILCNVLYFFVCLHFFQWKGYYIKRYLKYLLKNKRIIFINITAFIVILLNLSLNLRKTSTFIINLIFLVFILIDFILFLFKSKKIKFIFTARIFRIILFELFIILWLFFYKNIYIAISLILTPFMLIGFNFFDLYRYYIDRKNLRTAISKLKANKNLIVVGITGSNGKTSVKQILVDILNKKFNVIYTQKNQNTTKGAIIAINKFLRQDTQIFICEMGAKKRGDIKEICKLVNPSRGIVTNVFPQHLETFKTEQNIYLTKKELPDFLGDKYCTFNLDNPLSFKMFEEKRTNRNGVSISSKNGIYVENIKVVNYETYFDICYQKKIYPCHTKLTGSHNITNILLALDMALHLGIDITCAIQTIIDLQPTPHRLQYIKSHIDIIDDTYNCSIASASAALEFLKNIDKIKVVCTPGIVEGGKLQFSLNQQLSNQLNLIADIAIIVGKTNRKALTSKLSNFDLIPIGLKNIDLNLTNSKLNPNKKQAYIVDSLKIAKVIFSKILNKHHVLLLLNDLPDEYN